MTWSDSPTNIALILPRFKLIFDKGKKGSMEINQRRGNEAVPSSINKMQTMCKVKALHIQVNSHYAVIVTDQ